MKVQGSCHCGKITYAANVDPGKVIVCSCSDSVASVPITAGSFQLRSGAPARSVEVAEMGAIRLDSLCVSCGSVIYSSAHPESSAGTEPQKFWLYTSWLKQRSDLRPKKLIRCRVPCGTTDRREPRCRDKQDDLRPKPDRTNDAHIFKRSPVATDRRRQNGPAVW